MRKDKNSNRIWRNLLSQLRPNPYRHCFNRPNNAHLSAQVQSAEQGHRGEIRLVVESQLSLGLSISGCTSRQRALQWFSNLKIWDTEENSGILLYILLAEKKIEIIADRGISARVAQADWDHICQRLQTQLAAAHVVEGLSAALQELGDLLRLHFPIDAAADNPDELSNELVFIP